MSLSQEIIEKILQEVDPDIREIMMREEKERYPLFGRDSATYKGYQLLPDPANTILGWQAMRTAKKEKSDPQWPGFPLFDIPNYQPKPEDFNVIHVPGEAIYCHCTCHLSGAFSATPIQCHHCQPENFRLVTAKEELKKGQIVTEKEIT